MGSMSSDWREMVHSKLAASAASSASLGLQFLAACVPEGAVCIPESMRGAECCTFSALGPLEAEVLHHIQAQEPGRPAASPASMAMATPAQLEALVGHTVEVAMGVEDSLMAEVSMILDPFTSKLPLCYVRVLV